MNNSLLKNYIVKPGAKIKLRDWKTQDNAVKDEEDAEKKSGSLRKKLYALQELLSAGHEHKVLVILQGIDTAGKDGTIRHVFSEVNPQTIDVSSFKVPTHVEADHDYLWRVHQKCPGKGQIMIFNRSHYEDVIAVRVKKLAPKEIWEKRFGHINDFERMLSDEGTLILKFFLHIGADEQRKRLKKRLEDPTKLWKFNAEDVKDRKLWPEYMRAFEDVLSKTNTAWAPWHIIPADAKWYRNLVVSSVLVAQLEKLHMKYPRPKLKIREIGEMLEAKNRRA